MLFPAFYLKTIILEMFSSSYSYSQKETQNFLFQGHGDKTPRNIPKQVKEIGPVGQVACGSSHTLVVSQDGKTVWSFGGGDNGKQRLMAICNSKWINLEVLEYFVL